MSTERIRKSIETAIEYLAQHRSEARYTDSLAIAELQEGLKCRIVDPQGRELLTDMVEGIGDENTAPSPGWLLRAALASCTATLIGMRAAQRKVELSGVKVLVDSESDDYGILGMDEAVPAGPLSVSVRVQIASENATDAELREVVDWAVYHCPVVDAVRRDVRLTADMEITK